MTEGSIKIGLRPPHPGTFIREEFLDEFGLSIGRAATILGVRRATLSDLLNGKSSLSAEMALRVEKAFGVNMDTLLRLQAWCDAYAVRQNAADIDVQPFKPGTGG
jgi:addiction module HigA family antidote